MISSYNLEHLIMIYWFQISATDNDSDKRVEYELVDITGSSGASLLSRPKFFVHKRWLNRYFQIRIYLIKKLEKGKKCLMIKCKFSEPDKWM